MEIIYVLSGMAVVLAIAGIVLLLDRRKRPEEASETPRVSPFFAQSDGEPDPDHPTRIFRGDPGKQ
jgi:hypothetical protein